MLEYDWENSIGCWICSTSQVLRKELGAHLLQEGITLRQWEVLSWLSCNGCGAQTELAEGLGIEPHTIAGIISRMERDGLLERKSCERDRRKNTIRPTAKAEALWQRVSRICHEVREQAIQGFSEQELRMLRSMCERIQQNVSAHPDQILSPVGLSRGAHASATDLLETR